MFGRIPVIFLLRQKRKADPFTVAPSKQINHQQIKQPQPLTKRKEVQKGRQIAVQFQYISKTESQNGIHTAPVSLYLSNQMVF